MMRRPPAADRSRLLRRVGRRAASWVLRTPSVPPAPTPGEGERAGPALRGSVDWPKHRASVPRGILTVSGWAASRTEAAQSVIVTVDGQVHASAAVGHRRVDVAAHFRDPRVLDSGFDVTVDLTNWPRDDARITVAAQVDDEGEVAIISEFTVHLVRDQAWGRVRGAIDWPLPGTNIPRGVVRVVGWAAGDHAPVDAVEVFLGGESRGLARIGLPRADLVAGLNRPHALLAGFEQLVDLAGVEDSLSSVTLEARALSALGTEVSLGIVTVGLQPAKSVSPGDTARGAVLRSRSDPLLLETSARNSGTRLLAVTHHLGLGGGQLYLSELLEKMGAGREFPCTVVAPGDGPLRRRLERMGVTVHVTSGYPIVGVDEYEGKIAELAAFATQGRFTHVLVNTLGAFIGADLGNRLGLPVIWAIHESFQLPMFWAAGYPGHLPNPYVRDRAEQALRSARTVIFEADATRRLFDQWLRPGQGIVVPYGIDNHRIARFSAKVSRAAARRSLDLPEDMRLLLCLGTIEPRKNQIVLAEAFADAHSYPGPPTVLALVGDLETPYSQALKEFVAWRGLSARVVIEPIAKQPYRWYRASDALVSAADVESMPRSMLEAMSFGVPVAAVNVFGVGELVTDGVNGLLGDGGRLSAVQGLLARVLSMRAPELQEMGARGRVLVQDHYGSHGYADVVRGLLEL